MNRKKRNAKLLRRRNAVIRYAAKRRTSKWKNRKRSRKLGAQAKVRKSEAQKQKPFTVLSAPSVFCLISNTNDVLGYFEKVEKTLRRGDNVTLDISKVSDLSAETVALMVASIKDPKFTHGSITGGNAPKKPALGRLFKESGFYQHVSAYGFFPSNKSNFLHREVHHKVEGAVAMEASITGTQHVFGNNRPFDPLYNVLVECMSNTNDHANLKLIGGCKWWLYVYCNPNKKVTSYTFLDRGVGIFHSAIVQGFINQTLKGVGLYKNINLVDDLLAGRIQSRVDRDNQVRGKGIPQIVEESRLKNFKEFYMISNDVKVNLKSGAREQLKYGLRGTMWYWELHQ